MKMAIVSHERSYDKNENAGNTTNRGYCYCYHSLWVKTLFCSFLQFLHIGFLYNFGLFFDELQEDFHSSAAIIGWIGSTSYCLFSFGAIFTTWALRHIPYCKLAIIGVLLGSASLYAGSFAPSIVYLIITYGVAFGMSVNISMIVTLDFMVVLFHDKRRAKAMTLVALGATVGNLSMSNLIEYILELFRWRWVFRIFAVNLLILGLICCSFMGVPNAPQRREENVIIKKSPDTCLIYLPEVWFISVATLTAAVAMVFQYVNMASFCVSIGLTDQKSATSVTLGAFGDSFAKIVFIVVSRWLPFPLVYCLPVCLLVSSILSLALTQTKNTIAIYIISFCFGMPRGIYNALQLAIGLEIFGTSKSKTSANLLLIWSGIGFLTGPYIHGSLYDVSGSYYHTIYLCAVLYLISSITMIFSPLWQKYFAPNRYMMDLRHQQCVVNDNPNHSVEYVYLEQKITVV